MIEDMNRGMFAEQLNTFFHAVLEPDQHRVSLELIEVGEPRPNPRVDNYSLLFRGPKEFCLVQSMYPLDHESLGSFDLFLVPVGDRPDGFRYEAIINRLVV
ncbi:MAG: hypothetical protein ABIP75_05130 [Pyrinomonadaceae bacterium]